MTFQECLSFSPFEVIWQHMSVLYPDDKGHKDAYEKVYNNMLEIESEVSEYRIRVEYETYGDYSQWTVSGVNDTRFKDIPENEGGLSKDHPRADELVKYAIQYQSRAEWAGMVIDSATVCEVSTLDIAVHCLWEMTFAGFEEDDVQRQLEEIQKRADESKNFNSDDYVEIREGVFCHKDMVEEMTLLFTKPNSNKEVDG